MCLAKRSQLLWSAAPSFSQLTTPGARNQFNRLVATKGVGPVYDFIPNFDMHPRTRKQKPRPLPPSIIERLWPYPRRYKADYSWIHWIPKGWIEDPSLAAVWLVETCPERHQVHATFGVLLNKDIHKEAGERPHECEEDVLEESMGVNEAE
ncbi:hypothetical protein P885DRAFT_62840 [Corynascus similis CBS 632.67]